MLIDIVEENSELQLLSMIERKNRQGALSSLTHFQFSDFQSQPNHDQFVLTIKECLIGLKAAVYFCADGDVFVAWRGAARNILSQMVEQVQKVFSAEMTYPTERFPYRYYDIAAHGEELRIICKRKIQPIAQTPIAKNAMEIASSSAMPQDVRQLASASAKEEWRRIEPMLKFGRDQIAVLASAMESRRGRKTPHILVVEDQTFSRLLLHSSLRESYNVDSTENAKDAIALYAERAPDIVFLDIELPDGSGHQLAELFQRMDPQGFVVMVTAHNARHDVMTAKENGARAFVLKPYNKQKIFDCIASFQKMRKKLN